MRGRHKKVWGGEKARTYFQTTGAKHPVIAMTINTGPETGRIVVAELDLDLMLIVLQAMIAERDAAHLTTESFIDALVTGGGTNIEDDR